MSATTIPTWMPPCDWVATSPLCAASYFLGQSDFCCHLNLERITLCATARVRCREGEGSETWWPREKEYSRREYPSEPAPWDRELFEVFLDRDFVTQGVFHDPTIFDTTIFLTPRFF